LWGFGFIFKRFYTLVSKEGIPESDDMFFHARLKLVWANTHINQLHTVWQAFLKTDFCRVSVEPNSDGLGESLCVLSTDALDGRIPLIIGDAVHNLRCALDFAINEILEWKNTRITFPMGETREELLSSFRTEPEVIDGKTRGKGRNAAIEVAVPGIGEFIVNEICPYKFSDGFLWPLGKLDGRDKHRLLIPVLVPQSITCYNVTDQNNNSIAKATGTVGAGGKVNLAMMGAGGVKVERYDPPTAEIFFNEIGVIEGAAVLPTLIEMSNAVSETLGRIEKFVRSVRES